MTAIGIDFGSVNSRVGVWKDGSIKVISNNQGNRTTPSYVAFTNKERLIGDSAKSRVSVFFFFQSLPNVIFISHLNGRIFFLFDGSM
jgi:molecular chaperone DnaK (HSP70)